MNASGSLTLKIFDSLKKGVAIFHEGKVIELNSAFRKLFRLTSKENINFFLQLSENKTLTLAYPDKDIISEETSPVEKLFSEEIFEDEIWQVTDHNLGECWYGKFSSTIIDDDGKSYYILLVNDISESYLIKDKLQRETRFFYDVINALPVMITIYSPEMDEMYINDAVESITGWSNKDLEITSIMELCYPDPAYRKEVEVFMKSLKKGFLDIIMRTKDKRDIITSWANVKLSDGRQVGIGLDIHKQRITEKKLRESEEKFRNLADNISQLVWIADREGRFLWLNKRWNDFTGRTIHAGDEVGKLVHPDYAKSVQDHFRKSVREGKTWEDSFPVKGKNGEYHWFLSRAIPISDNAGNIKSWFGTNTDITHIKKLQDELMNATEKAENAVLTQKTFIQNISHEVRTPMNSILGFTELLEKSITGQEEKEYLKSISHNGKQLLALINDILDYSRLDSKDLKLSEETVNLKSVFQKLNVQFHALRSHFKKNNIELKVNIRPEEENLVLLADNYRLQQVMNNLISNAVKYTEKGYVEIGYEVQKPGNEVKFFVRDTGIGIDEKYRKLIFNRFQQTETKHLQGTGLGLAISKHIVELFGGEIWFESQINEGTAFYFTYPIKEIPEKLKKKTSGKKPVITKPDLSGKTILVVEDDEYSFRLLESMISLTNADIIHARSGNEALDIFNEKDVDLVFLDIRLPGLNGYETLKEIKSKKKEIPVIAQTAYAMPEDIKKSHREGFDYHATKPISLQDLYILLNRFLPSA